MIGRYLVQMNGLCFQKHFDYSTVLSDWHLLRLTLDWDGRPLLLFAEGKPPRPDPHLDMNAWVRWCWTPPKAHRAVYQEAGRPHSIAFDQSQKFDVSPPVLRGWLAAWREPGWSSETL